jgi:hypothetical protein
LRGTRHPYLPIALLIPARIEVEAYGPRLRCADLRSPREELAQLRRSGQVSGPLSQLCQMLDRPLVAERRGLRVELEGGLLIRRDAFALLVSLAEDEIHLGERWGCPCISLLHGRGQPSRRFGLVARNALSLRLESAEPVLRGRNALSRAGAVPRCRIRGRGGRASAGFEEVLQVGLRLRHAAAVREQVPIEGLVVIALDGDAAAYITPRLFCALPLPPSADLCHHCNAFASFFGTPWPWECTMSNSNCAHRLRAAACS